MRVHELAKELNVTSKELLATLEQMGVAGKSASSSVPEDMVPRLRASGGKVTAAPKSREVLEPPPAPRKPKPKPKPAAPAPAAAAPAPTASAPAPAPTATGGAAKGPVTPGGAAPAAAAAPAASAPAAPAPAASAPSATTTTAPAPTSAPAGKRPSRPAPPAKGKPSGRMQRGPRLARTPEAPTTPTLQVVRGATAQTIADKLDRSPAEIVKMLFMAGDMVTATTSLSDEAIQMIGAETGHEVEIVGIEDELKAEDAVALAEDSEELVGRAPVVTIMGHVDHGKTRLLDAIRHTNVVAGEFGGITQHIGAYQAHVGDREITFVDTPGHEAFTAMRARGAQITDIAVLVVAADDGVMPQTLEALDHAKAAEVPIVVAVNKVDKDEADPNRVRTQMTEHGIVPSEWGGDYEFVDVSAKAELNLDTLLDTILVVADLEELKGDPTGLARGAVIEAHLDKGRGPVATVLVQKGTLQVGDALVSGTAYCKVRAMLDENGGPVDTAGPSKPVQLLGWSAVPTAGDDFREVEDEREARHVASEREAKARQADLVTTNRPPSLQELFRRADRQEIPELTLVVKADVQGSLGALTDSLLKLPQDEVRVNIVRSGVGAITENDISLALASNAIVLGFNVRPDAAVRAFAEEEGVDIRLYRVIYDALDDIRSALSGMLKPEEREKVLGEAEVRQTFRVPRLGVIAGSYVRNGTMRRNASARLIRDGVVIYDGKIASLRRFKEDVTEVRDGFECGIGLENYQDIKEGDVVEAYDVEEFARSI